VSSSFHKTHSGSVGPAHAMQTHW